MVFPGARSPRDRDPVPNFGPGSQTLVTSAEVPGNDRASRHFPILPHSYVLARSEILQVATTECSTTFYVFIIFNCRS